MKLSKEAFDDLFIIHRDGAGTGMRYSSETAPHMSDDELAALRSMATHKSQYLAEHPRAQVEVALRHVQRRAEQLAIAMQRIQQAGRGVAQHYLFFVQYQCHYRASAGSAGQAGLGVDAVPDNPGIVRIEVGVLGRCHRLHPEWHQAVAILGGDLGQLLVVVADDVVEQPVQLIRVLDAFPAGRETLVVTQLGQARKLEEPVPVVRAVRQHDDPAVLRAPGPAVRRADARVAEVTVLRAEPKKVYLSGGIEGGMTNGAAVVAHTNNTGSMRGLLQPGMTVWLSRAANPRRKLAWTLELMEAPAWPEGAAAPLDADPTVALDAPAPAPGRVLVGVNTAAPLSQALRSVAHVADCR